jgi:hypothetical protein
MTVGVVGLVVCLVALAAVVVYGAKLERGSLSRGCSAPCQPRRPRRRR